MLHVERHIIKRQHPSWSEIDHLAFLSKNLYNAGNYHMRQYFFETRKQLDFNSLYHKVSKTSDYYALPTKVSKQIIRKLHLSWSGYFAALREYRQNSDNFLGQPRIAKYKHKANGRNILIYPETADCKRSLKKGLVKLSKGNISVATNLRSIVEVRIIQRSGCYIIEVVYEQKVKLNQNLNSRAVTGIDLGINNLMAVTSNQPGFKPIVINGRPLKAINQLYNRKKAALESELSTKHQTKPDRKLDNLIHKRNCRVDNYLHSASRLVIDYLVKNSIGTLVIGKNDGWKQSINLGKQNNQQFTHIPHARLISMLEYKAQKAGIKVILTEESYTSIASFLDGDDLPTYPVVDSRKPTFSGKRIKRGLYQSANGSLINSDLNGSYNIIRKVFPNAYAKGIVGLPFVPVKVNPLQMSKSVLI
jgi:putative transposase